MALVQKAFTLCNRHGIDCISAGAVIAFAMECFEEGLLSVRDTDGIELRFGNGPGMLTMLEKICSSEGFGSVLAGGVREAARQMGKGAERFAIETKGLEIPAHDPRANAFFALSYATSNRGGCHLDGVDFALAQQPLEVQEKMLFAVEGTAERVAAGQHAVALINSLIMCGYSGDASAQSKSHHDFKGIPPQEIIKWFSLATGMDRDFASLMHAGEVIYNLKHLINLKCGYDPASDSLHERFTSLKREGSPFAHYTPEIKELVEDYYRVRGWLPDGRLCAEKLEALGLHEL
jgi:aldehyde:ferredoxin oxidoreductase